MTFTTVSLMIHDVGAKEIADYVDDNDKFVSIGNQAYAALAGHRAIHYVDPEDGETFIPYHAVSAWSVKKEPGEYTQPDDEFCKPACPDEGGSNKVGEAIVDEAQAG